MKDILLDAKRLIDKISPAAWGQTFVDGPGSGISLSRVLDCIGFAKRENDPSEGYIKASPVQLLYQFITITSGKRPAFKSESDLRAKLNDVYIENTSNFSGGEKSLFGALLDIGDPRYRMRFYFQFWEELDPLIAKATRPPRPKMVLVED